MCDVTPNAVVYHIVKVTIVDGQIVICNRNDSIRSQFSCVTLTALTTLVEKTLAGRPFAFLWARLDNGRLLVVQRPEGDPPAQDW